MLANAYVRLGHDVTVVSPACKRESDALYKLETLKVIGSNRIWKWAKALARYKFDADLVHFSGDDFLVPSSAKYIHLRTFMGSCLAEAKVATKLKDRFRMTYLGITEFVSSLRFPAVTVISHDTNRYLGRPAQVIPCGVDLEHFAPGPKKHDKPAILFVGTLDSRKRGRELLRHFENVVKIQVPDAELWVIRETEQVDVPGVTVFGSVSQESLIDLYQRAWIFCLPSTYEGFGVPYIEAMACGTPVVATRNPGALEVLDDGRYGLLTDIECLGNTLVALLSDEKMRGDLSMQGLHRASEYDIHEIANRYVDVVNDFARKRVGR